MKSKRNEKTKKKSDCRREFEELLLLHVPFFKQFFDIFFFVSLSPKHVKLSSFGILSFFLFVFLNFHSFNLFFLGPLSFVCWVWIILWWTYKFKTEIQLWNAFCVSKCIITIACRNNSISILSIKQCCFLFVKKTFKNIRFNVSLFVLVVLPTSV